MNNLLPCPFCGGEARTAVKDYGDTHYWRIYCDTINCAMGMSSVYHSEAEAIQAWNKRAASGHSGTLRDELERTCKNVCKEWEKTSFGGAATAFCCSECGAHYVDCEGYYAALADKNEEHIRTNNCPNCGAKVINDTFTSENVITSEVKGSNDIKED